MSNIDLVKQAFALIEEGKAEEAGKLFSDDFTFKGPSLMTLTRQQYLDAHQALVDAIPDWKFNATGWQEQGNDVYADVHITGSHTRPLRFPFPGLGDVPPTNKRLSLPEEPTRVTVRGGKITSIEADTVEGGGIRGVFEQLGLRLPVPV